MLLLGVQESHSLLDQHKVILYESIFDKCTLIRGDHLIKATCQSVCKHFSHQLSKAVNQANGSEILHLISLCLLWD